MVLDDGEVQVAPVGGIELGVVVVHHQGAVHHLLVQSLIVLHGELLEAPGLVGGGQGNGTGPRPRR